MYLPNIYEIIKTIDDAVFNFMNLMPSETRERFLMERASSATYETYMHIVEWRM